MGRAWQGVGSAVSCPARQLEELGPAESPSRKVPTQHPLRFPKPPFTCSFLQEADKAGTMLWFHRGKDQAPERGSHSLEAPGQEPALRTQHGALCPLQPTASPASLATWGRRGCTSLGTPSSCPSLPANTPTSVWWSVPFLVRYD